MMAFLNVLCYNHGMNKEKQSNALTKEGLRKRATKEFIIGLVVAVAAGAISYASYDAAASSATGGTYTVYTGAIALGVVYAIKGGFTLLFPSTVLKWSKKSQSSQAKTEAKAEAVVEDDNATSKKSSERDKIEF